MRGPGGTPYYPPRPGTHRQSAGPLFVQPHDDDEREAMLEHAEDSHRIATEEADRLREKL